MKVLLVDDDAAVRISLKLLLTARGHHVDDYPGGQAVLDADLSDDRICLIADYLMPDIDGLNLLDSLRGRGWAGPALLITGHFDATLEQRARAVGYSAVFEKPLRDDKLFDAVVQLAAGL
jgi:FixJ family two-component response regulator